LPDGTNRDWFVVRTQPQRERYAAENVARAGYRTYFPKTVESVRRIVGGKRRKEFQIRPLFPCYLFAQHASNQWHALLDAYGVAGLVMGIGQNPALMRDTALQNIRCLEENGVVVLPDADGSFRLNQPVRVTEGPYTGFIGLVESTPVNDRVKVLMDYLGRKVPFIVRTQNLEAVA
jgi:transcription antitermination factor NusG